MIRCSRKVEVLTGFRGSDPVDESKICRTQVSTGGVSQGIRTCLEVIVRDLEEHAVLFIYEKHRN